MGRDLTLFHGNGAVSVPWEWDESTGCSTVNFVPAGILTCSPSVVKLSQRPCGSAFGHPGDRSVLPPRRTGHPPCERNPWSWSPPARAGRRGPQQPSGRRSERRAAAIRRTGAGDAPAVFTHPGVGVSRAQLDFVRAKVQAGAQPWTNAFNQAKNSSYASLSRTPKPRAVVECGSYSNPNYGCTDEREDAIAAYTDALLWYITRDDRYAQKAIQLMDAWSATIQRPHQQQRAAADRVVGVVVAEGRRDHQARVRQLAERRPLRHHAAQRLPARDHQRLELQRELGVEHDRGDPGHRRVPRRQDRVRQGDLAATGSGSRRSSTWSRTARCRRRSRARTSTPARRSSSTGRARTRSSTG